YVSVSCPSPYISFSHPCRVPISSPSLPVSLSFFFFNDTATTEIYTLSLHDALPILIATWTVVPGRNCCSGFGACTQISTVVLLRSEEHTSELQSLTNLVCRLLLEKKKNLCTHRFKYTYTHDNYYHASYISYSDEVNA